MRTRYSLPFNWEARRAGPLLILCGSLAEKKIAEAAPDVPEVVIDLPPVAPGSFIPIQAIQPAAPSQCAAGTQEK